MLSRRKPNKSKDAFVTSALAMKPSTAVVVTVKSISKPSKPSLKLSEQPRAPSSSSTSSTPPISALSSRPSSARKRKRSDTSEVAVATGFSPKNSSQVKHARSPSLGVVRQSQARRSIRGFGTLERPIARPCVETRDGNVPHLSSEDVVMRIHHESASASAKKGKSAYKAYFRNLADPNDMTFEPSDSPLVVELEYPNHGAVERFVLLFPSDRDDYQPIRELMRTISTISECYLTEEQRMPLGSLSRSAVLSAKQVITSSSRPASPMPRFDSPATSSPAPECQIPADPLLRTLEKAYHTKNGPLFLRTVEQISVYFNRMKDEMMKNAKAFFEGTSLTTASTDQEEAKCESRSKFKSNNGVPVTLWKTVMDETYQRSVGPNIEDTKKYKSFSSETYGELNSIFVSDLVHRFGLGPGKTFVDLGSGVGNCVLQAALQSGCDAYGIEINTPVAALSFKQQNEFRARLRMWGLTAGPTTLREGDFVESNEVSEWIRKADVVLVNNYIFSSDLNDALTWRFLDLREGAKVVVLKPFWPLNRPLTERTAYTPEAVLSTVEKMEYIRDSVSWTKEPGEFFIYTKSAGRASLASERTTRARR